MMLVAVLYAEDVEPVFERFSRGLGFTVGELAGIGISYRDWFEPRTAYQVCGGVLYFPQQDGGGFSDLLDYWLGVQFVRSLYATEFADWLFSQLYMFAGVSHSAYIRWVAVTEPTAAEDGHEYDVIVGYEPGPFTPSFGIGAGVGIEFGLFSHFSSVFELGYALFWRQSGGTVLDQLSVRLVPQGTFHYRY